MTERNAKEPVTMLERNSHVAIMPNENSPAAEVLEIASVLFVGPVYVQLFDGRMYASLGGKSLAQRKLSYIVPATEEHWAALKAKRNQLAQHA
ncbi:MAG TPA: hypothetical protein VFE46_16255 [Pirellulales bacterium]|jgi:predicted P-loop ATPase/GTPase|nr:hypothetical protein [Pirellulales bacterium]